MSVRNLEELLHPHIGTGWRIVEETTTRLTAPGDNFGSTMLNLVLKLRHADGSERAMNLVAKLIPESELFRKIFNVQATFKNEVAFYETVVPTLREFEARQGCEDLLDLFPEFYGARRNLDGGDRVDEDAVFLMENLKVQGYEVIDRHRGCDLDVSRLLIRDLARFHAVPVALKLLQPHIFDSKVKPHMLCFSTEKVEIHSHDEVKSLILDTVRSIGTFDAIIPKLERSLQVLQRPAKEFREPYASIAHRDMWSNNFMVKFDGGKPVGNRLIDFQNYSYDSPAKDLLFFLATSVRTSILDAHLDELIGFYHDTFLETLRCLGCPTEDFSRDEFLKEIAASAGPELGHIAFFILVVVFARKVEKSGDGGPPRKIGVDFVPEAKEKLFWVLNEFEKRQWLNI